LDTVLGGVQQMAQQPPPEPQQPEQKPDVPGFQDIMQKPIGQMQNVSEDDLMRSTLAKRQQMQQFHNGITDTIDLMKDMSATRIASAFGHGTIEAAKEAMATPPLVSPEEIERSIPIKGEDGWLASVGKDVVRATIYDVGYIGGAIK